MKLLIMIFSLASSFLLFNSCGCPPSDSSKQELPFQAESENKIPEEMLGPLYSSKSPASQIINDELLAKFDDHFFVLLKLIGAEYDKPQTWNFNIQGKNSLPVGTNDLLEYQEEALRFAALLRDYDADIRKALPVSTDFADRMQPVLKQFSLIKDIDNFVANNKDGPAIEALQEWLKIERERIPIPESIVVIYSKRADELNKVLKDFRIITSTFNKVDRISFSQSDIYHTKYASPDDIDKAKNDVHDIMNPPKLKPDQYCGYEPMPCDPFYLLNDDAAPSASQWGLKRIGAGQLWKNNKGDDLVVAVMDSGVDISHPDLKENIWINPNEIPDNGIDDDNNGYRDDVSGYDFSVAEYCFYPDPDKEYNVPRCTETQFKKIKVKDLIDRVGHGTNVAGVAASQENGRGLVGVSPNSKVMVIKVGDLAFDGKRWTNLGITSRDELAAFKYAADMGADVINMSWVTSGLSFEEYKIFNSVFKYLNKKNVTLVAAYGNPVQNADLIPDKELFPAFMPQVIRVAWVNGKLQQGYFMTTMHQRTGFLIDVLGPTNVVSPLSGFYFDLKDQKQIEAHDYYEIYTKANRKPWQPEHFMLVRNGSLSGEYYSNFSGSSASAPHISGIALLLKSIYKSNSSITLANEQVRHLLHYYAEPVPLISGLNEAERKVMSTPKAHELTYYAGNGFPNYTNLPIHDVSSIPTIDVYNVEFPFAKFTECEPFQIINKLRGSVVTSLGTYASSHSFLYAQKLPICGDVYHKDLKEWSVFEGYADYDNVNSWELLAKGTSNIHASKLAEIKRRAWGPTVLRIDVETKNGDLFHWTQRINFNDDMPRGRIDSYFSAPVNKGAPLVVDVSYSGKQLRGYELIWVHDDDFTKVKEKLSYDSSVYYYLYDYITKNISHRATNKNFAGYYSEQLMNENLSADLSGFKTGKWHLYFALKLADGQAFLTDHAEVTLK